MVRLTSTLSTLLPLLSLSLAQSDNPPTWEVRALSTVDTPTNSAQTTATPASHHIAFRIVDNQQDLGYDCAVDWTDASGLPQGFTQCQAAPGFPPPRPIGTTQSTEFQFKVESYADASGPFTVAVVENHSVASVEFVYNGSFTETKDKDGGKCFETPLQNNAAVTFSSCSWPTFFVPSTGGL